MKSVLIIDTPETCGDCPLCIFSAEEKRCIGYCNTSNEDYYCKALKRFMEYDRVEGGLDILGKPTDCPLQTDVLDKIRAEVERRKKNSGGEPSRDLAFNVCLQIIDKYKAESEDKE